jgi:Flp pilus assembly protein TadG
MTISQIHRRTKVKGNRRGAIAVLAAFLMVVMMAVLAFAIDVGVISHARTDLQRGVDAGALAAASELSANPGNEIATARQFVKLNAMNGSRLQDSEITVEVGTWNRSSRQFTANAEPADAVRVFAKRNNNTLFFAPAMGVASFNMQSSAVATFQPRDIMLVLD